jgi:hypothetical protein
MYWWVVVGLDEFALPSTSFVTTTRPSLYHVPVKAFELMRVNPRFETLRPDGVVV